MGMPRLEGKVLLTGASGFIGGRLRDSLLGSGSNLVTIRRQGSPRSGGGRSVIADYASIPSLTHLMRLEKPDYVLHVAGVTKGRSYEDFWRSNVMPTRNLLSALRRAQLDMRRFVLLSSIASYGPSTRERPHREEDPRRPIEHYGKSKLEAEEAVEQESGGIPWTIVRPSAVYGPGDVDCFNLFQSAVVGLNAFFGNRKRCMSLIYVDDCVRGIVEAARHAESEGKGYFLTGDETVTWEEFQYLIIRTVQRKVQTVDLPEQLISLAAVGGEITTKIDKKARLLNLQKAKMSAQEAWTCSADAAKRDFGFEAEMDLAKGVRRTHEWYASHGWYETLTRESLSLRGLLRRVRGS